MQGTQAPKDLKHVCPSNRFNVTHQRNILIEWVMFIPKMCLGTSSSRHFCASKRALQDDYICKHN